MENWGLVTYSPDLLYINKVDFGERWVADAANFIGHEIMHQWTGNLITCTWWDELWINEAFAEMGAYLALSYFEPEWNAINEIVEWDLFYALRSDALIYSRPIINKQNNDDYLVESPVSIARQFDSVAYSKGALILRMTIHVMEEKRWQWGMQKYLAENQYSNTDGSIYFRYMQEALVNILPTDKKWDVIQSSEN